MKNCEHHVCFFEHYKKHHRICFFVKVSHFLICKIFAKCHDDLRLTFSLWYFVFSGGKTVRGHFFRQARVWAYEGDIGHEHGQEFGQILGMGMAGARIAGGDFFPAHQVAGGAWCLPASGQNPLWCILHLSPSSICKPAQCVNRPRWLHLYLRFRRWWPPFATVVNDVPVLIREKILWQEFWNIREGNLQPGKLGRSWKERNRLYDTKLL